MQLDVKPHSTPHMQAGSPRPLAPFPLPVPGAQPPFSNPRPQHPHALPPPRAQHMPQTTPPAPGDPLQVHSNHDSTVSTDTALRLCATPTRQCTVCLAVWLQLASCPQTCTVPDLPTSSPFASSKQHPLAHLATPTRLHPGTPSCGCMKPLLTRTAFAGGKVAGCPSVTHRGAQLPAANTQRTSGPAGFCRVASR